MKYYLYINESEQYLLKCEEGNEVGVRYCFLTSSERVADKIEWFYNDEFALEFEANYYEYKEVSEKDAEEILASIKEKKLEKVLFEKFYDEYSM